MFPTPIERTHIVTRIIYRIALPIAVVVWLLPLIAILITSIRGNQDIIAGNYWGWP